MLFKKGYMYIVKHGLFPLGFSPVQVLMSYVNMELQVKGSIGILLLDYYINIPCVSFIFLIWSSMMSYVLDIVERMVDFYEILVKIQRNTYIRSNLAV